MVAKEDPVGSPSSHRGGGTRVGAPPHAGAPARVVLGVVCAPLCAAVAAAVLGPGCSPAPGVDGSKILLDFDALRGGVVFATSAIPGSKGYDLYWVPTPSGGTALSFEAYALTSASGDEWQPSVSRGGNGIAFARSDGVYLITTAGLVRRVSDTSGTSFRDTLPAVSYDGTEVAWVRSDTRRAIEGTVFFETTIMSAPIIESAQDPRAPDPQPVNPRPGVVQDAPVFEPIAGSRRIAWSEFNATTLGPTGPRDYGIYIHDPRAATGRYACTGEVSGLASLRPSTPFRCFGQHLTWPCPEVIVVTQDFLEIFLDGRPPATILPEVLTAAAGNLGDPVLSGGGGFYPPFPISGSYSSCTGRVVFDGVFTAPDGSAPTLALFMAAVDGGGLFRLKVVGHNSDLDTFNTSGYLFSVATPQLIP